MKGKWMWFALLASGSAMAVDDVTYRCEANGEERQIVLHYPQGTYLPCEVQYTKTGPDGTPITEVLWHARNITGYCERKQDDFVQKQEGWGWQCGKTAVQQ